MIADQCLSAIQYLHHNNYIHQDIKPENFAMGLDHRSHIIHLLDFGLSKIFIDKKTSKHVEYKENMNLVGTPKYLSINGHLGIKLSRRDDLESLGYMLIYLMKGYLPWQEISV